MTPQRKPTPFLDVKLVEGALSPCPFCGASPKLYETKNHADCLVYYAECTNAIPPKNCKLSVSTHSFGSVAEVMKIWNRRI